MLLRHEGELVSFLELVDDIGCGTVRTAVLKAWFGSRNVSVTMWREIAKRWAEISSCPVLLVAEAEGAYTFVYGAGLKVDASAEEGWLVDINDWC